MPSQISTLTWYFIALHTSLEFSILGWTISLKMHSPITTKPILMYYSTYAKHRSPFLITGWTPQDCSCDYNSNCVSSTGSRKPCIQSGKSSCDPRLYKSHRDPIYTSEVIWKKTSITRRKWFSKYCKTAAFTGDVPLKDRDKGHLFISHLDQK